MSAAEDACGLDPVSGGTARPLKWSRTNRRIAEDRLPCWRAVSISPTSSDSVTPRAAEISFIPVQNASSRLTLVLWPSTTIERFTTGDFMVRLLHVRYHHHPRYLAGGKPVVLRGAYPACSLHRTDRAAPSGSVYQKRQKDSA